MTNEELIKQAKAAYAREWRKKNPEKAKEISNRYWLNRIARENDNTKQ